MASFSSSKKKSLDEVVARLAAEDGSTFRQSQNSNNIRKSLEKDSFNFSRDKNSARKCVWNYYEKAKNETKAELAGRIERGDRFSLSLDEYTSKRNRRYVNINVHGHDERIWCVDVVRCMLRKQST